MHQDHHAEMPIIGKTFTIRLDTATGEHLHTRQDKVKHEGSFSTSIKVQISGNRIIVDGNPSRFNRPENLFGFKTIDECVAVYNRILEDLGLPLFTRGTKVNWLQGQDGSKAKRVTDGAVITEIHCTSNISVGKGNVDDFLKAISTQPYRQMIPRLLPNGKTADWLTKKCKGSDLIYPSVYNKAHELEVHALRKYEKKFGKESEEANYIKKVIDFCNDFGVARFEQKYKSRFLQQNKLQFWGIDDFSKFNDLHDQFIAVKDRLTVEVMDFQNIAQQLIVKGACENTRQANTTAMYALQWMHGETFNSRTSQMRTHRARLRQIGIDINMPCDITKFSCVVASNARVINVQPLPVPIWYQMPRVAA